MMLSDSELWSFTRRGISVEIADTQAAIQEAQALRHQVFRLERGVFAAKPGATSESDEFDQRCSHVVIRDSEDSVIATARVVGGSSDRPHSCLPMQNYCTPDLFRTMDMDSVGEISRFAISKEFRRNSSAAGPLIRLALLKGILRVSQEMALTHWCALMEPALIRLLGATGVHFVPLGPMVEAWGLRQPSIAAIGLTLSRGRRQKPDYYHAVSNGAAKVAAKRDLAPSDARPRWIAVASARAAAADDADGGERSPQQRERRRLRR